MPTGSSENAIAPDDAGGSADGSVLYWFAAKSLVRLTAASLVKQDGLANQNVQSVMLNLTSGFCVAKLFASTQS